MATITWTSEARRWLQEIYDHIAQDNPDAAYRVVMDIYESAGRLAQFPELGFRYKGGREVRMLLRDQYRIAYLITSPH